MLAESLDLPLRERNRLLEAGGFARVFTETPLAADEMSRVRSVLQFILDRHAPYAAVVLDRFSNCLMGNQSAGLIMSRLVEPHLLPAGANMLRAVFHPDGMRRWIVNWPEVGGHLLDRAERELTHRPPIPGARHCSRKSGATVACRQPPSARRMSGQGDLLLPVHIRRDGLELRLFSTIMTLGTPHDVTLQELRLETLFPADEESETRWRALIEAVTSLGHSTNHQQRIASSKSAARLSAPAGRGASFVTRCCGSVPSTSAGMSLDE